MKTVKTISTVTKMISVCAWLVAIVFFTGTVRAVEPDQKDDFAVYGIRQVRITNPCGPAVPSPLTQAAADAIPCATTQVFIVASSNDFRMEPGHQLVQPGNQEVLSGRPKQLWYRYHRRDKGSDSRGSYGICG